LPPTTTPVHPDEPRRRSRFTSPPGWRREALRTTLWLVPSGLVLLAVLLFVLTNTLDHRAATGDLSLPSWVNTGGADAARTILTSIAASIITVVGVVFSVTIVALTLASTQFGPRMLRNFIRDRGTQFTLGTFVATVVFCVLALASVTSEPGNEFVPHLSVTVALGLTLIDLGVLIYFIHHVTKLIQVTDLIGSIAGDLGRSIDQIAVEARASAAAPPPEGGLSLNEVLTRLDEAGVEVPAQSSGYLQAVGHRRLVKIASRWNAVVRVVHRPGHFLVQGRPLAIVWPAEAAPDVARELGRAHVVGPHRTLFQDPQFGIDQLVEISIRALSPAVNDTFTALTCIDWIGDALCKLLSAGLPNGVHRDTCGHIRLIEIALSYDRLVARAFDKIRQAGRGMPAVGIRQLENLAKIADYATTADQRRIIMREADMILRAANDAIPEANDLADVKRTHDEVLRITRENGRSARTTRSDWLGDDPMPTPAN
jgi:uncharacterized membrane protein